MSQLPDRIDRSQIEQGLDLNMLVEASAGTGKTECLCRRIANALVNGDADPENTVAITFTRKAASELRGRLRLTLEKMRAEADEAQTTRVQKTLERLDYAFVGTIHSFCSRLLREHPIEAGVSPGFMELDPLAYRHMMGECFGRTLDRLRHDAPVLLGELIRAGIKSNELLPALDVICQQQDVTFDYPLVKLPDLGKVERKLTTFCEQMAGLVPEVIAESTTCPIQKNWRDLQHQIRFIDLEQPESLVRCLVGWRANHKIIQKYWPGSGQQRKQLCQTVTSLVCEFANDVSEPFMVAWRSYLYGRLLKILNAARDDFRAERLRSGQLDYGDLLSLSAKLLESNLEVRRRLQSKFRWLFVDEFQDTDPLQATVLLLLASTSDYKGDCWREAPLRPGALFLVGDPKQSIYRFRRADIDLFEEVKKRIEDCGGKALPLTSSFRSVPSLCDWNNKVFSSLLPKQSVPGQAKFNPLISVRSDDEASLCGAYVLTSNVDRYTDVSRAEAERLANQIVNGVRGGEFEWRDFMILTARRAEVAHYSRALETRGVPVEVAGARPQEGAWGSNFFDLLYVLATPEDPIATVGVLRGPLYGIDDETLYLHRRDGGRFNLSYPGESGHELVLGALSDLNEMRDWVKQMPAGAVAERILDHTGILASAYTTDQGEGEVPALLQVVAQIRNYSNEGRTLAQSLELLQLQEPEYPVALNTGCQNVVRIMNLHQAKGLQARVVMLAAPTSGMSDHVSLRVVKENEHAYGFLSIKRGYAILAEPHDWSTHEAEEAEYVRHERTRLLYVATTRARDALVVGRWDGTHKRPSRTWEALEPFLDDAEKFPLDDSPAQVENPRHSLSLEQADNASVERLARWAEGRKPTWSRSAVTELGDKSHRRYGTPAVVAERGPDAGAAWGDLIHRLLEQATRIPQITDQQLTKLARWFAYESPELFEVVELAVSTVRDVLNSDAWQKVLSADRSLAEVPFGVAIKAGSTPTMVFGVVDLALEKDGTWELIDHKTDHLAEQELADRYSDQLQNYAQFWRKLAGEVGGARLHRVRSGELSRDLGTLADGE